MKKILGIRREDKNRWERRVPIIPEDLKELKDRYGIEAVVQPSELRIYNDEEFRENNVCIDEDLKDVNTIFAVKEIPAQFLSKNKTYIYFSHTIKGQQYNMAMLRKLMAQKCNLIDYERIVDEKNQRLIFFGVHAGYSGMIETLYAFAEKIKLSGIDSPLSMIKQAYEYESLEHAKEHIRQIGNLIAEKGLPEKIYPLIVGFAGYGNVSQGAQKIFDLLPVRTISPDELAQLRETGKIDNRHLYKVVFKEQDMVRLKSVESGSDEFELEDYYDHPEKYESAMKDHLCHLDILVNCIYWTEDYPRLVTRAYLRDQIKKKRPSKLAVIGDISCDIKGAIEITRESTMPDNACFTYSARTDRYEDSIVKDGITVMAIDNLPCEFSKESSIFFSNVLKKFAKDIVTADFNLSFDRLALPYPVKRALILHKGEFTEEYEYMKKFI